MASSGDELRLPIGIPVETNAVQAADSIQALRDSLVASKDAIKATATAMRDMRGGSDAVKAAKDQLRSKLEAEKTALSDATLKLVQHGAGLEKVKEKAKAAEQASTKLGAATKKEAASTKAGGEAAKAKGDIFAKAIGGAGGPVASLKGKLDGLNETLGGSSGGMAAVAGIAALAAAAILAVGAAAIGAAWELTKFIVVSADAARMMQLTRKANLGGNDEWAKNLGDQIDALGRTIPVAKERLNELGISLAKSRIGGQTMIDTLKAVGGATAAAGDDLGNKLKGIVERGAFTRRFQLSPQELMGMDLDFNDVAKAYAAGMHVSVNRAREELVSGRVKLADGAKALKDAVESKFGAINADKLISLDNQTMKFKQDLAGMAKDVNLTPLLQGLKSLGDNFDQASVNGKAMKGIITTIGNAIGVTFEGGVPAMQTFIDKAVWGALKVENYWLRAKIGFRETFGTKTTLEFVTFKGILSGFIGVLETVIPGFSLLVEGVKLASITFDAIGDNIENTKKTILGLKDSILAVDWPGVGHSIVDGIVDGLDPRRLVDKMKGLAGAVKRAFTGEVEIKSPSKVFERYGKNITQGAELGIEKGTPAVQAAAKAMAPKPGEGASSGAAAGGGGRSGGAMVFNFNPQIIVQGGGGDVSAQLKDPSLLQAMSEHLIAAIRASGIAVAQ